MDRMRSLRAFRVLFSEVLLRLDPRAVGIICYYHLPGMALAWACRSHGLPCIEIQHGKQGKHHGMYTHWISTPTDGYELLPSHFWTWGEESRRNIAKWLPPSCESPQVEALGLPWLSMWLDGPGCEPGDDLLARLTARLANRKVILFSMQPLDDPLPAHLLQAIKQSPPSWLWLMRLHPRDLDQVNAWAELFARSDMENVECRLANEAPLFTLLKRSHHHVTCYSSVSFEALVFGLSTTLIHPIGRSLYDGYRGLGHFRQADTAEELLYSVRIGIVEPPRPEDQPYIVHDQKRMRDFLRRVMWPCGHDAFADVHKKRDMPRVD